MPELTKEVVAQLKNVLASPYGLGDRERWGWVIRELVESWERRLCSSPEPCKHEEKLLEMGLVEGDIRAEEGRARALLERMRAHWSKALEEELNRTKSYRSILTELVEIMGGEPCPSIS